MSFKTSIDEILGGEENLYLHKYLRSTDNQRSDEVARTWPHYLDDYLISIDREDLLNQEEFDDDPFVFAENFQQKYPELFLKYGEWL